MEDYTEQLKEQLSETNKLINILEKRMLQNQTVKEGVAKVSYSKGHIQYYFMKTGDSKFRYVPASETTIVQTIMQDDYNTKMLLKLKSLQKALSVFIKNYHVKEINNIYDSLGRGRRMLVKPLIIPDEEVIQTWYSSFETGRNGFQDERKYATENGDMVRSKSEKIIADILFKHNIPYVYEPALKLNGHVWFPDFAVLNVRKRKTIYWEHFGLISDSEYAEKNMRKILEYEEQGLICGDNLIFTMESSASPLSIKLIEKKINLMLLN